MPKISIIVAIYNAQAYIERCIDSILSQSFTDFELLLINDGSKDASKDICLRYAAKDSRVKFFDKPNGGVASVREFGIEHLTGEYSIHADPDDWVEKDWLEVLYAKALETQSDITVCDYFFDTKDNSRILSQKPDKPSADSFLCGMVHDRHLGALWNKLLKVSVYKQNDIHFINGLDYCEDFLFMAKMLTIEGVKLSYVNKALYHYDQYSNLSSYTRLYNQRIHAFECQVLEHLRHILPQSYFDFRRYVLAYNEFNYRVLSPRAFKEKYSNNRVVLLKQAPWKLKPFLLLASMGLMTISRGVYAIFQKIKNN